MKVLLSLDIDTPDLYADKKAFDGDIDEDEALEVIESAKQNIIDGLTSVDMQGAIAECLATWYLSVRNSDVDVSMTDALEVLPSADRRKLRRFTMRTNGSLTQEGGR